MPVIQENRKPSTDEIISRIKRLEDAYPALFPYPSFSSDDSARTLDYQWKGYFSRCSVCGQRHHQFRDWWRRVRFWSNPYIYRISFDHHERMNAQLHSDLRVVHILDKSFPEVEEDGISHTKNLYSQGIRGNIDRGKRVYHIYREDRRIPPVNRRDDGGIDSLLVCGGWWKDDSQKNLAPYGSRLSVTDAQTAENIVRKLRYGIPQGWEIMAGILLSITIGVELGLPQFIINRLASLVEQLF